MSDARFATITSALLTRKGLAAPSFIGTAPRPAPSFGTKPTPPSEAHWDAALPANDAKPVARPPEARRPVPPLAYQPRPAPRPAEPRIATSIASAPIPVPRIAEARIDTPRTSPRSAPARRETARPTDRKRRVVLTMSVEEYQRLGIVAAKMDSTRQELVRAAVFARLDAFARDQAPDCRCIGSGQPCDCESPSEVGGPKGRAA
jgi:hypothetical protein